jgi:hypothetical protein
MTDHPILFSAPMVRAILDGRKTMTRRIIKPKPIMRGIRYAPGDRLWVREGWASVPASAYRCSEGVAQTVNPFDPTEAAIYRAGFDRSRGGIRWRSPIHMPRWASRITLAVEAVRVERLQDISEGDSEKEGVTRPNRVLEDDGTSYTDGFAALWEDIHGPDAWDANPWVSVTTFRRVEA